MSSTILLRLRPVALLIHKCRARARQECHGPFLIGTIIGILFAFHLASAILWHRLSAPFVTIEDVVEASIRDHQNYAGASAHHAVMFDTTLTPQFSAPTFGIPAYPSHISAEAVQLVKKLPPYQIRAYYDMSHMNVWAYVVSGFRQAQRRSRASLVHSILDQVTTHVSIKHSMHTDYPPNIRIDPLPGPPLRPKSMEPPAKPTSNETCAEASKCDACLAVEGCGWCASSRRCVPGDNYGPLAGTCTHNWWDYTHCEPAIVSYDPRRRNSGGTECQFRLHNNLGRLGFRAMAWFPPRISVLYATKFTHMLPSQGEHTLSFRDTIVYAGGRTMALPAISELKTHHGVRYVVQYWMGHHFEYASNYQRHLITDDQMILVLMHSYSNIYDSGVKYINAPPGDRWWVRRSKRPVDLTRFKSNTVIVDGDSKDFLEDFEDKIRDSMPVQQRDMDMIVMPAGFTEKELEDAYVRSKATIDLSLPAYEYGNLEGSVFGTVWITSPHISSRDGVDMANYPTHKLPLAYYCNVTTVTNNLANVFSDYETAVQIYKPFLGYINRLLHGLLYWTRSYFDDDVTFYVTITDVSDAESAGSFLASTLMLFNYASVELLVMHESFVIPQWMSVYEHLKKAGYGERLHYRVVRTEEYKRWGAALPFITPPRLRRKWTLCLGSIEKVFLGNDLINPYAFALQPLLYGHGESRIPQSAWISPLVSTGVLADHLFVHTDLFFFSSQPGVRSSMSTIRDFRPDRESIGVWMYEAMVHIWGQETTQLATAAVARTVFDERVLKFDDVLR
jgi:hypothetical protein